ncbi:MAG: UDP-N-acetylglucosamine 1-carboxyvinyltransferase [Verrucomicrobiota bacterium]
MALEKLLVRDNGPLSGSVSVSGSKNASLPILAATLLTDGECIINRVPDLSDTNYMFQILGMLGADVERSSGRMVIEARTLTPTAPYELVRKMRASVCVLGPLLGRLHEAKVAIPGGCVIGDRPIDLHLRGFEALGAQVEVEGGNINLSAPQGLTGTTVNLSGKYGSTVLGTDNVMMAATLAEGTTIIEGAAVEPEVIDLADFLNGMGARISGAGTPTITIEGVEGLVGREHTVIPDRIEAGTFLVAGAITGGNITIKNVDAGHQTALLETLRKCGFKIETDGKNISLCPNGGASSCDITTLPYPGFATDMQAQMCALFATTPGKSVVVENIFPQRFMHIAELTRMGANISLEGATATIQGVEGLSGAPVMASDLRASAALVLAGLKASGETEVSRLYHIDRGYEHIDRKLRKLGADVERVPM